MNILFLTSRFPFPPYRGDKLKIYNLIREVSRRHSVSLLSFVKNSSEMKWIPELQKYCRRVEVVPLSPASSVLKCLTSAAHARPFQVSYFDSDRMRKRLRTIVEEEHPDVIHTHLIRMAPYTASLTSIPRILDLTDAVSLYLERFRNSAANPVTRWLVGIEWKRMVSFEPVISAFDRVLVCSEVDREVLGAHVPGASIDLLRNGIDLNTFSVNGGAEPEAGRIIFTGNMSYYPNADAARYFVRSILPLVKKEIPSARLYIVGQNPSARIRALASRDVIVTGFVEDIRAEYLKSGVAVSPVRFGAGTLNKILEPLALGIPVVATPLGVEGLGTHREGLIVADTPEQFAEAMVKVLKEKRHSDAARVASVKIRSDFSWERIGNRLEEIYLEVTGR